MCRQFRKKKANSLRWPKNLKEAQDAVAKIEKKFKGEVIGIQNLFKHRIFLFFQLKDIVGEHSDLEDGDVMGQKDLNVIEEDDEDEDDENRFVSEEFSKKIGEYIHWLQKYIKLTYHRKLRKVVNSFFF